MRRVYSLGHNLDNDNGCFLKDGCKTQGVKHKDERRI